MAPRLSKRQQREQEELLALATHPSPNTDLHESTEEESVAPAKTGFAALLTPEDQQEVAESEDENTTKPAKSRKTKKRKKKAVGSVHDKDGPPAGMPVTPPPQVTSRSKPATKKVKAQDKKEEKDDLDKALAELSIKYPDLQQIAPSASTNTQATKLSTLFSVSVSHLDAESELKKFFGSKAVSAAQAATSTSSPKRRRGVQPQTQRSQLARPQPSWGMMKPREGLSARPLTEEETTRKVNNGPTGTGKWWTVEYSKRYKGVTKTFMQAVMTGDPETLWRVLQRMPWHADTLLQLAEVYRHREEYSQAVDYVSRALYAYERAFLGAFSFTSGNNRLDFDRVENRPFFLAIHRQVIDLQRCGCPRTAFEHARLLISLEPLSDPHGVYLQLDYLCVKAGMGDWLLDVWSVYRSTSHENSGEYVDPTVLPGWSYARALILRAKEKEKKERGEDFKEESTEALRQAILAFPVIVPLLADKCEISLSAEVRGHKAFRIHTDGIGLSPEEGILHLLAHLYAQRSSPLWKSSGHASWLSSTSNTLLSTLSTQRTHPVRERSLRTFSSRNLRHSIYRHVFVLEQTHAQPQNRVLTAFIPSDITQGRHLACDPLPPPSAISTYDAAFFAGSEDPFALGATRPRRRTQAEERLLARLIPDVATRAQILAFYDQNPWIAAQVPGGVVEFVQMMAEAPDDALHELMIAAEMMREGVQPGLADRGAMPGELLDEENEVCDVDDVPHGQPGHQEEDDEDEDEDDEDVAPMPIRVVRNLLNRLWGGAPAQEYEDSSDDDGASNG
ncbi:transcriptional repressor TCF25-domain-containing protein [Boletus edulis BED1]|uniref:Transcriptional repressor TCF25-domain-containing protein n=1 Tax=Boletus edulis BED1 TaxID=1328754 RepID=A0AAD4GBY4_BOLED|nr:transcriptional repressor TCF25-domain-containing protein [Boletus edulis BED1]